MAERAATLQAEQETAALKKLQVASGFATGHGERLDWMYEQSVLQKPDEDKLMNMAVDGQKDKDIEDVKALGDSTAGSLFLKSATKTTEDMLRKLREDPLFQIKRQEQAARENMMANPLVQARLQRKQAKAIEKESKKAKKAAKKEKKAMKKLAKKEKKAKKVKGASSSSSSSSSSEKVVKAEKAVKVEKAPSRCPPPKRAREDPFGAKGLGPADEVLDKRAERAAQVAARRDAAYASRGSTKRLDEEERQRKLEQMRADANVHEKVKDMRIARAEKKDQEEEEREKSMRDKSDQKYFKDLREQAYLGDQSASVADRLKNQRHRRQKHMNDPLERDG